MLCCWLDISVWLNDVFFWCLCYKITTTIICAYPPCTVYLNNFAFHLSFSPRGKLIIASVNATGNCAIFKEKQRLSNFSDWFFPLVCIICPAFFHSLSRYLSPKVNLGCIDSVCYMVKRGKERAFKPSIYPLYPHLMLQIQSSQSVMLLWPFRLLLLLLSLSVIIKALARLYLFYPYWEWRINA